MTSMADRKKRTTLIKPIRTSGHIESMDQTPNTSQQYTQIPNHVVSRTEPGRLHAQVIAAVLPQQYKTLGVHRKTKSPMAPFALATGTAG